MTAEAAAWENPLMPNARLREMYLAMMQARTLARAVPLRRGERSTLGLEACLVSPAVDLGAGDLVSDVLGGAVVDFLRAKPAAGKKSRRLATDCGQAATLPRSSDSQERIWTAVGAAAALQSLASRTSAQANAAQPGVTLAFLLPGEVPAALLKRILSYAREKRLPLIFVCLPAKAPGAKAGRIGDLAARCGVPAIPTDAADAVAIYRVTQESIGHARIGGGPALVEFIPFATAGNRLKTDAITGLADYMLPRKVVTQAWLDRETKRFARRLAIVRRNA